MDFLKNKSSVELRAISKKADSMAKDLKLSQPSYGLAIQNGCHDRGYNTVNGYVSSYGGVAEVTLEDGSKWKCIGHSSGGDAYYASDGYIEFIPLN